METFTLEQLSMITSLTTRTLRNYIRDGILKGEKVDGKWQFTKEQVSEFSQNPFVVPALDTKRMNVITDYLRSEPDKGNRVCMIFDVTDHPTETYQFFARNIPEIVSDQFNFSMEVMKSDARRIILRGSEADIFDLLDRYREERKTW